MNWSLGLIDFVTFTLGGNYAWVPQQTNIVHEDSLRKQSIVEMKIHTYRMCIWENHIDLGFQVSQVLCILKGLLRSIELGV